MADKSQLTLLRELKDFLNNPDRYDYVQLFIESQSPNETLGFNHVTSYANFFDFKETVNKARKNTTLEQYLLSLILSKGYTHPEFYTKANLSPSYFHKLTSGKIKKPSKNVLIQCAIALELNNHELDELLRKNGDSLKDDAYELGIHWLFKNGIYDKYQIDEYMSALGLPTIFN